LGVGGFFIQENIMETKLHKSYRRADIYMYEPRSETPYYKILDKRGNIIHDGSFRSTKKAEKFIKDYGLDEHIDVAIPEATHYLIRDTGRESKVFKSCDDTYKLIVAGIHDEAVKLLLSACKNNGVKAAYRMGVLTVMAHETNNDAHKRQMVEFLNFIYGTEVI